MEKQEIFDKVTAHLRSMKERSGYLDYIDIFTCFYHAESGAKCAIGCLIPAAEYDSRIEGQGIGGIISQMNAGLCKIPSLEALRSNVRLAISLQIIHDKPSNWTPEGFNGEADLKRIATQHSLTYSEPL